MRTFGYNRQVGRPVLFLGLFTVEELIVGMVLYSAHQVFDGRTDRLLLLAAAYVGAITWLRLARRRGHAWHRLLTVLQPRRLRSGGRGGAAPWA